MMDRSVWLLIMLLGTKAPSVSIQFLFRLWFRVSNSVIIRYKLALTLQTYSSCVRTSTHLHKDEPSTCSSNKYFSATSAAWNWCSGGWGDEAGTGDVEGDGVAVSRSVSGGDCALSSEGLLCSPGEAIGVEIAGLLSRSGHNNEGDPGSITLCTTRHCHL